MAFLGKITCGLTVCLLHWRGNISEGMSIRRHYKEIPTEEGIARRLGKLTYFEIQGLVQ